MNLGNFEIVSKWISDDEFRLECLRAAASSVKYEWYLSAGFVKNQARMSLKHGHESYNGCIEAMSYWPEIQTAVGVRVTKDDVMSVRSPFLSSEVVRLAATRNPKCTSSVFQSRVSI